MLYLYPNCSLKMHPEKIICVQSALWQLWIPLPYLLTFSVSKSNNLTKFLIKSFRNVRISHLRLITADILADIHILPGYPFKFIGDNIVLKNLSTRKSTNVGIEDSLASFCSVIFQKVNKEQKIFKKRL